jgi:hypothetical protein
LTEPVQKDGEWVTECRIYPTIPDKVFVVLPSLPPEQQKALLDYHMQATIEWGRASPATVKMSTMQPFLREMSIKRAVTRCCRKFSGIDFTSFEELPEAHLSTEQIEEAKRVIVVQPKPEPAPSTLVENKPVEHEQTTIEQSSEPSKPMPELCRCGHQKRLHVTSQSGEVLCMVGTKEHTQCECDLPPGR